QCTDSGVVDLAGVLVVVTVHAQQLPVAAVGRIVVVVVIAVVDRQLLEVGAGEISRAAAAGPWIHLQGTLPIALRALFGAATGLGDDAVGPGVVGRGHGRAVHRERKERVAPARPAPGPSQVQTRHRTRVARESASACLTMSRPAGPARPRVPHALPTGRAPATPIQCPLPSP